MVNIVNNAKNMSLNNIDNLELSLVYIYVGVFT